MLHLSASGLHALLNPRGPALHNRLEPAGLVQHFMAAPPQGFSPLRLTGSVPAFAMRFDLSTTVDPETRAKLKALPFARSWWQYLCAQTCFVGTTVSEYALLPRCTPPETFVRQLLEEVAPHYPFLIVKDIPVDATLVGAEAHGYSRSVADACRAHGFVLLQGQALAYVPVDFDSIDDLLGRMSRSRRRDIRRKLKTASSLQIRAVATGDTLFDDERILATFYEQYLNVYRKSTIHFDLLSAGFWRALLQDADSRGIVFMYCAGGEMIGYNVCFVENGALVDKYVGFAYPQAREHNVYIVSWFRNLQYALDHRLRYYVAGWTDLEIKRYLGARFTMTQHAVYARNSLLRGALRTFKRFFETDYRRYAAHAGDTGS